MTRTTSNIQKIAVVVGLTLGAFALSALADWSAPVSSPPQCISGNAGCDAPINTGSAWQYKNGQLSLGTNTKLTPLKSLYVLGGAVVDGLVTDSFVFTGGTPVDGGPSALGKVLTADANGVASWQTPTGSAASRPVVCSKSVNMNNVVSASSHTVTFVAADCGGTLPGSSYAGALSELDVCYGFNTVNVFMSGAAPTATWYGNDARTITSGNCGGNTTLLIRAIYFPTS